MKALTLTQPWATLVVTGQKARETRQWSTRYRGPLAIHAAKGFPDDKRRLCKHEPFRSALGGLGDDRLPTGVVVGVVQLLDCVQLLRDSGVPPDPEFSFGDYRLGRWIWYLGEPRELVTPVPMRGELGLWNAPQDYSTLPMVEG